MKLVKRVIKIGNGAAVYVPKQYEGEEIVLILPEKTDENEIKRKVMTSLIDFMPNILGVYLYGSYSRKEQNKESDIDLMIIVKKRDKKIDNTLHSMKIDARILTLNGIKKLIRNLPALIVPILRESKAFLNEMLLEELKKEKIDFKKFNWNFQDIKSIIKIIEGFIDLDSKDISPSHIYSIVMRIRILLMIESLIKNIRFENKKVRQLFIDYGFREEDYEKYYKIYQNIRDDREVSEKPKKEEFLKLIIMLKRYMNKIENETKKKT